MILLSAETPTWNTRMAYLARIKELAESATFDASRLNFNYNLRSEDDFDTFEVTKLLVVEFAEQNGQVDPATMFDKLVSSMNRVDDASDELYYEFVDFCKGGN